MTVYNAMQVVVMGSTTLSAQLSVEHVLKMSIIVTTKSTYITTADWQSDIIYI